MRRVLVVVLAVLAFQVLPVIADDATSKEQPETAQSCEELKASGASAEQIARRGCCSWHQGVCGCSGSRVACCDGTLSPSCRCHADDPKGIVN